MSPDNESEDELSLRHRPCPFEKNLLSGAWSCTLAEKYLVAHREGMNCRDDRACAQCTGLLEFMTTQSRFALGLSDPAVPLSHGQGMKLRNGLLQGLRQLRGHIDGATDIHELVAASLRQYGDAQSLPVQELLHSIAESRRR